MTPAARLAVAIELLEEVLAASRPADALLSAFFRARRFIGAKDRADIAGRVYAVLRHWARLQWWLGRLAEAPNTPRMLILADLALAQGAPASLIATLFSGGKFAPTALSVQERSWARHLEGHTLNHPEQPEAVRAETPPWAEASLRSVFQERFMAEMTAMLEEAPMDVRINPLKITREAAILALAEQGIEAKPTPLSPLGLRLAGRVPLMGLELYKSGALEIQDEGSQVAALLADAQPGMQVADFCAGAGGKTLAMAAMMHNKGRVVATDVLAGRLERAKERFRRAGLHNIETRALKDERDPWLKRRKAAFDRTFVDAPCSGVGTWRRNPDARWRALGPGLDQLLPRQAAILDSAARLVRPGGRLIYATCSLLHEENEGQVERFLAAHPDFSLLPVERAWPAEGYGQPPLTGPWLRLTPLRHGTDGFFAAVLQRAESAEAMAVDQAPALSTPP
jgi:16S rRNA (cytosine967-C5)-methyltransferase